MVSKRPISVSSKTPGLTGASPKKPGPPSVPTERPKRRAGRSLLERNPDWVQFAPEGKEGKRGPQRRREKMINEKVILKTEEESLEVWKSERFRREHRKMLEFALSQWSGWNSAIRTGSDMEKEVFKKAASQEEYLAGINRLVTQFKKRSVSPVKGDILKTKSKEKRAQKESDNHSGLLAGQGKSTISSSANGSISEVESVASLGKSAVNNNILKLSSPIYP